MKIQKLKKQYFKHKNPNTKLLILYLTKKRVLYSHTLHLANKVLSDSPINNHKRTPIQGECTCMSINFYSAHAPIIRNCNFQFRKYYAKAKRKAQKP